MCMQQGAQLVLQGTEAHQVRCAVAAGGGVQRYVGPGRAGATALGGQREMVCLSSEWRAEEGTNGLTKGKRVLWASKMQVWLKKAGAMRHGAHSNGQEGARLSA